MNCLGLNELNEASGFGVFFVLCAFAISTLLPPSHVLSSESLCNGDCLCFAFHNACAGARAFVGCRPDFCFERLFLCMRSFLWLRFVMADVQKGLLELVVLNVCVKLAFV